MTAEGSAARKRPDDLLLDEAADWIGRLRAPDLTQSDRVAFSRWLERSPAHRAAYDTMADLYDGLGVLATSRRSPSPRPAAAVQTSYFPRVAAAACLLSAALLVLAWNWATGDALRMETARGETLEQPLPDGSLLVLNTDSSATWSMDESGRYVDLALGGELFVDVAHDPARPFQVRTDHGSATALGTAFGVRAEAGGASVSVTDGTVAVRARDEGERPVEARFVEAGAAVVITANREGTSVRAIEPSSLAWREGRLVYADVTLAELVEDLNRYLPRRITISDDALGARRVSAVLRLSDQAAMLDALGELLPLDWVEISDQAVVIYPT